MVAGEYDLDDVLVMIGTNWGDYEKPLTEWMTDGPGLRDGRRPESARSRSTGQTLPLTVVPPAYRNDRESRALIAAGSLASPWRVAVAWRVDAGREPPCEVFGPRRFPRSVADSERIDRVVADVLRVLPSGVVGAEAARVVSAEVPEFGAAAAVMVRRLAAEARWDELDAIVLLAAVAGFVAVAPVLCEVLESDARPPRPGCLVDALGLLGYDAGADLLESLVLQFVYAYRDLSAAQRCLRALAAMRTEKSRARLMTIYFISGPGQVRQWAAQELEAAGVTMPPIDT